MPDTRVFIRRIPKRYKISTVWGKMGRFSRGILAEVSKTTLWSWYEVKGCIFFLFCDVFRRIATQKQLFFADLRDCVALGMEVFCVHATFLDFGDNLRCMKQVARLAGAPRNLLICRVILHKPCNLAGRACEVTGCRPKKKQSPTASYVSELPTKQREFVFLHGL